ncbi:hypothetical protein [Streptomyces sp. NPDC097610]|jgi:hypothetical protein|uniref:hypothetical protein n=1 Tax=unclassified Streptomyces TaxID=2593676 RepID=UPI00331F4CB4
MRLLGALRPGHRQVCVQATKHCTCYLYPGQWGRRAKVLRRRAQRYAEKRMLLRRADDA